MFSAPGDETIVRRGVAKPASFIGSLALTIASLSPTIPASSFTYRQCFAVDFLNDVADEAPSVYLFDYGVVVCFHLDETQELSVVRNIACRALSDGGGGGSGQGRSGGGAVPPGAVALNVGLTTAPAGVDADELEALAAVDLEVDRFSFVTSATERPHISNDTISLHRRAARDPKVKLAIAYALSQSTKLSVYERRVTDIVNATRHLPEALARDGVVSISTEEVTRLVGSLFIQRAAVNLLSSVLDVPEFFWREKDSLQALYNRILEYLELQGERGDGRAWGWLSSLAEGGCGG